MINFDEDKQEQKIKQLRESWEKNQVNKLATEFGLSSIDLTKTPINTDALRLLSEDTARTAHMVVFYKKEKELKIAVRSPEFSPTKEVLANLDERGYVYTLHVVSTVGLQSAWNKYKELSFASKTKRGLLDVSGEEIEDFIKNVHSLDKVREFTENTFALKKSDRVSKIVEVFIASALSTKASDIHIEPEEYKVRFRLRLDGILTDITKFDNETYELLRSRIKLLSGMKLNIQNEPQDGRFSIHLGEANIEIRTSMLPGEYGESIVMRILNPESLVVNIEELGMEAGLLDAVQKEINKPNGLILTTGPTGSGKTTTLYSFLQSVHTSKVKIITIEDPIEYHLEGIVQTQTDSKKDYTFASGLRASLRQDPDVIMVGEIRDKETAEIAIHASLTGHTVFSTLHTNNAAGTFPRLIDLGVNSKIISSAVNIAIAQRLVRVLCKNCKKETPLDTEEKVLIDKVLSTVVDKNKISDVQTKSNWLPGACDTCGGSGYKGRIGVFEAVLVDRAVEEAIRNNPSEREIREASLQQGILDMTQDAVLKVLKGVTSIDEVKRVIGFGEY
jgi:type IV pilus assembly protein PilB